MKPMSTKCKVINVLIMNIPVALFISLTAQLLAIAAGEAPGFSFALLGAGNEFLPGLCHLLYRWHVPSCRTVGHKLRQSLQSRARFPEVRPPGQRDCEPGLCFG